MRRRSEETFEQLTDVELAGAVYLAIIAHDDDLPDEVTDLFWDAQHMASVLWARLRGPYCNHEGCGQPHMASFPWCPWHRPESHGPLPDGYPPYPGGAA